MKKLSALFSVMIPFVLSAQNVVTVQANIKGLKRGEKVYYRTSSSPQADSVKTTAGGFTIHIKIPAGEGNAYVFQIGTDRSDQNAFEVLYLDKGTVTITGNGPKFKDVKYTGSSPAFKDLNAYESFLNSHKQMRQMDALRSKMDALYTKGDTTTLNALYPELQSLDSVRTILNKQWIREHTSSPVSAYIVGQELRYKLELNELDAIMNSLTAEAKNNAPAKEMLHKIALDKLTEIGKPAIEFAQPDSSGNTIALKDFRGKYVLVDFWASWCHPCREENPNVLKAYNLYKDKNFTVLGVSFDWAKENWLNAVHKDGLPWNQVCDLKGWENAAGKQYGIESIPANFLIDPTGKIIAKNLRGDDLENKLAEVLKD